MADRKTTALAELTDPTDGDWLKAVDVSEPLDADKNKKLNANKFVFISGDILEGQLSAVGGTLTDAVNIAWDLSIRQVGTVTLAGNRTLDNPTNMQANTTYILIVKQDATGSRTLAYGTAYKWPEGTAPVLSTAANAVDILTFVSDGTNMYGQIQKAFA